MKLQLQEPVSTIAEINGNNSMPQAPCSRGNWIYAASLSEGFGDGRSAGTTRPTVDSRVSVMDISECRMALLAIGPVAVLGP